MVLVIGGYAAGKKQWVKENLGFKDEDFSADIKSNKKIMFDLQNYDAEINDEIINMLIKKEVIICNEVGCGIVPTDKKEREQREKTGRLLITLAARAESVFRIYCGIGQKIK